MQLFLLIKNVYYYLFDVLQIKNNYQKFKTNNRIRYIIPVNYDEGIIMISYTDGKYSDYWKRKIDTDTVEECIKKELDKIFPDKKPKTKNVRIGEMIVFKN